MLRWRSAVWLPALVFAMLGLTGSGPRASAETLVDAAASQTSGGTFPADARGSGTTSAVASGVGLDAGDSVVAAAGDIAGCGHNNDEATAQLLDSIAPTMVLTLGDNAYPDGRTVDFTNCYQPTWGRHKPKTSPIAGNHDYHVQNAANYFSYFGAAAGDPSKGYYAFDLGTWRLYGLNSNCGQVSCAAGSPQEQWLRTDLAAHPGSCSLAFLHHPRFSSAETTNRRNNNSLAALYRAFYDGSGDVWLNGHNHQYERLTHLDPSGAVDLARGVRIFIAGTGGAGLYAFGAPITGSEVRSSTHGVLKLTLRAGGYDWAFVPVAGKTFTDAGTDTCGGGPAGPTRPPVADFDGDGKTDISVYRPVEHRWYSANGVTPFTTLGLDNDLIVPGDYDGDGDDDFAVFRPSEGRWYVNGGATAGWGIAGDIPVPADYDGDGDDDFAIYRPSERRWYSNNGVTPFTRWGIAGDVLVPGDYDGDGDDDFAVWRPSERRWYVADGVTPFTSWGMSTDIPVPGDYDDDGDTDFAVYRPSEGRWYVMGQPVVGWGIPGPLSSTSDRPQPGDYDGDGDTDRAVFRPSEGRWYVNDGVTPITSWGLACDLQLALPYSIRTRIPRDAGCPGTNG